jgi:hypothetical protein
MYIRPYGITASINTKTYILIGIWQTTTDHIFNLFLFLLALYDLCILLILCVVIRRWASLAVTVSALLIQLLRLRLDAQLSKHAPVWLRIPYIVKRLQNGLAYVL